MTKQEKMLTELLAMRARLDDLIAEVRADNDARAKPEPTYMKIDEFCKRWDMSRRTFHSRVGEGLPTMGSGHDRRVKVTDGDAWMQQRTGGKRAA